MIHGDLWQHNDCDNPWRRRESTETLLSELDEFQSEPEEQESEYESEESESKDDSASRIARRCSMINFGAF